MRIFLELLYLLLIDAVFVAVCVIALAPLFRWKRAAYAVAKRNFVGYFSNPTGYVFLCLFVALTSFAAFWPHDFFTANLANLDQLNAYLPYIMLVFIPAITMSIWSEERRQGTDELLLTLPAGDFDIVIGKYLAAAAIFTASLLFSQIANYTVLLSLAMGDVDLGLFTSTYLGYWMAGMAMLSVGMVASFLTKNLTIGFILGLVFNLPLVFMKMADLILTTKTVNFLPGTNLARLVSSWSIAAQFEPFGRGVITLSAIAYFAMIIVVGLYLSMVLISARHWHGGRDGHSLFGHYLIRSIAMIVTALGLTVFFTSHDFVRADVTRGRISSLSEDTKQLVRGLKTDHPIYVDAFISAEVPEQYVKVRLNLISMLKEFEAMSGDKIQVNLHNNLEPFSEEAALAEEQFGIRPQDVRIRSRGAIVDKKIILGAAFRCGLQKVVVPFFDYGIPVEYELIRSINTVAQKQRKKLGVVRTDAQLYGGFTFAGGRPQQLPKQAIVEELEKQYDVEEVDLSQPIEEGRFDVLLVVQPSSLMPESMDYLIEAIRAGTPTAIFEDPLPSFMANVPGTGQPKQPPGGMFGGQRPLPKADIRKLWDAIGIESPGTTGREGLYQPDLVWQRYNPYPKLQITGIPDEWVFVREEPGETEGLINPDSEITSGLFELFFPFPGAIEPDPKSDLKFTKLVTTRKLAGTITYENFMQYQTDPAMLKAMQRRRGSQTVAALIKGSVDEPAAKSEKKDTDKSAKDKSDDVSKDKKSKDKQEKQAGKTAADSTKLDTPEPKPIRVVYVSDIDLMIPAFLRIRARPDEQEDLRWRFENVTFLLNAIDVLSGDTEYINIRKRKPEYSTLKRVEARVEAAREQEFTQRLEYQTKYDNAVKQAEEENQQTLKKFQDIVNDLQKKQRDGKQIDAMELKEKMQRLAEQQQVLQRRLAIKKQRFERDRERSLQRIRREVDLGIQRMQFQYKLLAVAIPWIPPFLIGVIVFVRRRLREREGIEKSRLR